MEKSLIIIVAAIIILVGALVLLFMFNSGTQVYDRQTDGWLDSIDDNKNPLDDSSLDDIYEGKKPEYSEDER